MTDDTYWCTKCGKTTTECLCVFPEWEQTSVRHIGFLTEVSDYGAAYECQRCEHTTATKVEMWEHRSGLITPCEWARFKSWLNALRPSTDD